MAATPGQRDAAIFAYRIPLCPPIPCAGRLLTQREGLVLRLRQGPTACGWGEAAPLPGFSIESLAQCRQQLIRLADSWLTDSWLDSRLAAPLSDLANDLTQTTVGSPSARFGFSCALHELAEGPLTTPPQTPGYPLLQGDPESLRQHWLQHPEVQPPSQIKLKLARGSLDEEIALVQALLAQTPALRLRIDCNQGWTLAQAQRFLAAIGLSAIDYLEEPCRDLEQSLLLSQRTGVPLALDESLRQPSFVLPQAPGLIALIIKPSLSGSLQQLRDWIALGQQRGLRVILSSSYESSLGLTQIAALAAQLTPAELPGVDTAAAFSCNLLRGGDPAKPSLAPQDLTSIWAR